MGLVSVRLPAADGGRGHARPFTRLAICGLGAHVFFELASGVGMPLASVIGPLRAATLWATATGGGVRAAATVPKSCDPFFATANAAALAVVTAHLSGWPRRPISLGLPWLVECEGLDADKMPAYNCILYLSGAAALAALLTENAAPRARFALAPLCLIRVAIRAQHAEHRRMLALTESAPRWWNRGLRRPDAAPVRR
jgi:hypothetical protein